MQSTETHDHVAGQEAKAIPPAAPRPHGPRISRFDRIVFTAMALFIGAIVSTIALGDRVGVTLVRAEPLGVARSTSPIVIQFSEPMDRQTVESRLRFEPDMKGVVSWSGTTMVFRPERAMAPGESVTVILDEGARSEQGREVLSEYQYSFTVASPRVAWLSPADSLPQNIWIADPTDPASARQLTNSPSGIYDFGVSPDGTQIAFAERNDITGTSDIKLLDIETGGLQQITNCVDADCTSPVWRPDGRVIAYNRVDYNSELGNVGTSPTRVWLIDLTTNPVTNRPLFSDLQILGYGPQWSADGSRIALFNRDEGIMIYDFTTNNTAVIPSRSGTAGALSPDGTKVIFPEITFGDDQQTQSFLQVADLADQTISQLTPAGEPVMDERVVWSPDGQTLAVARRYQDERYTRGYQVYLMDPDDGSATPLTTDERYANGFFTWDPTGTQLVIQRFPELDESGQANVSGRPEIWTYDISTQQMRKVADNAFHPRWVP